MEKKRFRVDLDLKIEDSSGGYRQKRFCFEPDPQLIRDLMEGLERSDDEFSIRMASSNLDELNYLRRRERVLNERRAFANRISEALAEEIVAALGQHDKEDGYGCK